MIGAADDDNWVKLSFKVREESWEDEVGKMTDVSAIVPLLQAIFAILLDSGKTLRTVAANCETVSTKSARPAPVGGFAVP